MSGHINTVQVDRAQGGTTIIINNSGGSSVNSSPTPTQLVSQNTSTESAVPLDVAESPNQQPFQPKLAHFPVTLIGSKRRAFNSD